MTANVTLPVSALPKRRRLRLTLNTKLVLLALVALAMAATMIWFNLAQFNNTAEETARSLAARTASTLALEIQHASEEKAPTAHTLSAEAAQRLVSFVHKTEARDLELITTDFRIIADADPADIGKTIRDPVFVAALQATFADGLPHTFSETVAGDKAPRKQMVVAVKMSGHEQPVGALVLEYTRTLDEIHNAGLNEQREIMLVAVPFILLMLLAALLVARNIARSVQRLHKAAIGLTQGQHVERIGHYSHDELGDLAQAFDVMIVTLETSKTELRNEIAERRLAQSQVQAANAELEERVEERTTQLMRTNQRLDGELEERRNMERQLLQLARFDQLTGLPNRSNFLLRLEQAMDRVNRTEKLIGLMFVDLDRFKSINDSLGHETGDKVLQEVAERMRSLLRKTDTVSRIGGDEFTIIVEDVDTPDHLAVLAQKLVQEFAAPLNIDGNELFVTLSLGIAISPTDSRDMSELLKQADVAMYHAKAEGRNGFQFHSENMGSIARQRLAIEQALRHALERNEFRLYYQARVSAKTNLPVGMEALLRWDSSELGSVSPVDFVPIAEDTGLIVDIGEWVLRSACQQHQAWCKEGLRPGTLGVNVSARQFKQPDFVARVWAIAAEVGIAPGDLELEVTESMLMSDPESASRQMHELRALGFGIAIDDFGTGYSSLSQLKLFPATKIKIDRAFVHNIDVQEEDAAIASAIVAVATTLNMQVTAEGVETPAQLARLDKLACSEYQGMLFSEPLPACSMGDVLRRGLRLTSESTYSKHTLIN